MGNKGNVKKATKVEPATYVKYHGRGGHDKAAVILADDLDELTGSERNLVVFSPSSGSPSLRNAVKAGTDPGTYSL